MADYVINTNTMGFYKFNSSSPWNTNSIVDNPGITLQGFTRTTDPSSNWGLPTTDIDPNDISIYKPIYKSRPSSLKISESNGISFTVDPRMLTTEFWFYPKRGTNTSNPNAAGYTSLNNFKTKQFSNPFLFTLDTSHLFRDSYYGLENYSYARTYTGANDNTGDTNFYYWFPIFLNLGYCCYQQQFVLECRYGMINSPGYNVSMVQNWREKNNCPPNRWYHIAITQQQFSNNSARICWFINGNKISTFDINIIDYNLSQYKGNGGYKFYYHPNLKMELNEIISIGNRCTWQTHGQYAYQYYGDSIQYINVPNPKPGFQDVIIDNLVVSRDIVYTNDFIPPGFSGIQLLNINDKVYGYDKSSFNFTLMADNWSSRTDEYKRSVVNQVGYCDITIDDIKSVSNPNNDATIEVYKDNSSNTTCELVNNSYEETIIPSTLINLNSFKAPEASVESIKFDYNISDNSYIKVLFTNNLSEYKTFDFINNQWVTTNITNISTDGIPIDQVQNIPKENLEELGINFAIAYFMHLEPYGTDCSITDLNMDISLQYGWKHCNMNTSTYEYPIESRLRIIFSEEGAYKINYLDKKGVV